MSRDKPLIWTLVGAAAIGYGVNEYASRYSSERVWKRQKTIIDSRAYPGDPVKSRVLKYEELKGVLSELDRSDASREQRCMIESRFAAVTMSGNAAKAEKLIDARKYETYEGGLYPECNTDAQLKDSATKWYNIGGIIFLVAGIARIISPKRD